jgi:hypothetical protein
MKNKILILFALVFALSFILASDGESIGTYQQDSCVKLPQTCADCTYSNISAVGSPNGTLYSVEKAMTKSGTYWEYEYCNTSQLGEYKVNGHFDVGGIDSVFNYIFEITPSGKILTVTQAMVYLGLLVVLILMHGVILFITNKLPPGNSRDEQGKLLAVNNLKYLRNTLWYVQYWLLILNMFIISNIAATYLGENMLANVFHMIFQILMGLALPVTVIWFVWVAFNWVEDRKLRELLNRGAFNNDW